MDGIDNALIAQVRARVDADGAQVEALDDECARTCAQAVAKPSVGSWDLVREAAAAWSDLSRACHHHPYELAPTANELCALLDIAHRFAAEVARQAAAHRSRPG